MDINILSIILYGSYARNDHDNSSDLDICIITKNRQSKIKDVEAINNLPATLPTKDIGITSYPEVAVDSMIKNGSLFLWHLKLEGKVLYGENYFSTKMVQLKDFINHKYDIEYHFELFQDSHKAWKSIGIINELDLSVLFTIARNTCMILSHYAGETTFGRVSCFSRAKKLFPDLPLEYDDYLYLSHWKLIYERGGLVAQDLPDLKTYNKIVLSIKKLLEYALDAINR